ncbi:hypothetical protein [Catelliglobosispora koreensis]|uniref:hypothetical protein n=1 Tax=Catelliglobosispora koreensis TaxID=129052 RepID=UPI000361F92F|nr:hypothetical protein [Catelliglobosispora koreensis]
MKKVLSRLAVVTAASFTAMLGITSPAYAGDTVECVSVGGYERGCITHNDDGDTFSVCDTRVDGEGVYGAVQEYINSSLGWVTRASQEDGGDPGCDKFAFDVTVEDRDVYRLKICWPADTRTTCDYDPFRE